MAKRHLTVAFDSYDYLQPIREGKIEPEGVDLTFLVVESGVRHQRFFRYGEYDACEFSMSSYLVARARGIDWFRAIPFFPRRMFGHKFCFIRKGSGIRKPSDLRGRKIGIRSYENTLALAVKGMFMENYGLPVEDVTWVCTGRELVGSGAPASVKIEYVDRGGRLEELLLAGEVEATVEPDLPEAWIRGEGRVERLFPDFESAEKEYYKKTRVFPIMHPVVIKTEVLQRDPWIATSLFEALVKAQKLYWDFMEQPHRISFAWARSYLEQERAFFGRIPYPQGLAENRHDVQTLIRFADEQGMLARPLTVEELFTENTRET